ncbi:MAG: Hsp20/alpha crystallin family protein [Anaerolineae bacterium]|nr:Hsp20/alpha crystallin family protein [Anaerolineae bacterium]
MTNQNFDPMKALGTIRDSLNKLIGDGVQMATGAQILPVDVYETETTVVVKAGPVVGLKPEDIDVSVVSDKLTIKGEIKPDSDVEEDKYLKRERKYGPFSRTVIIPRPVKADQASASFKDGILTITLPKIEEQHPKVINITPVDS